MLIILILFSTSMVVQSFHHIIQLQSHARTRASSIGRHHPRMMQSSSLSSLFLSISNNQYCIQHHKFSRITRCFNSKQNPDDPTATAKPKATKKLIEISSIETDNNNNALVLTKEERQERINKLHETLQTLNINGDEISNAVHRSLTTMEGFDSRFGKSAIKTYKTFIDPKPSKIEQIRTQDVTVSALRCANQIDFLIKRHRSHETEWVRHTDIRDGDSSSNSDENDDGNSNREKKKRFPLVILLDNVRSAFNVGSIFRTADACGCSHIFTTGITPSPKGRGKEKLAKSALGADREVPSKHFTTTRDAVTFIREEMKGWTIMGMETTDQSKCYTDISYPGAGQYVVDENESSLSEGVVLILGNEVTGVDTEIMPLLDLIVEIPMFGSKNSLNIAACAPVVLYEILRQWDAVNDEAFKNSSL
jgi:23S rRNA (guanosine2251-2'-O)-methyltransferase